MLLRNESLDASIATVARETSLILSASHNQEEIALKLLSTLTREDLVRYVMGGEVLLSSFSLSGNTCS